MIPIFDYRIVQTDTGFMPQRGVSANIDGISNKVYWRDGVPVAAPSCELADLYVKSMQKFDAQESPGKVLWTSE